MNTSPSTADRVGVCISIVMEALTGTGSLSLLDSVGGFLLRFHDSHYQ